MQTSTTIAAAIVAQGLSFPIPSGSPDATTRFVCSKTDGTRVLFNLDTPVGIRTARAVQREVKSLRRAGV